MRSLLKLLLPFHLIRNNIISYKCFCSTVFSLSKVIFYFSDFCTLISLNYDFPYFRIFLKKINPLLIIIPCLSLHFSRKDYKNEIPDAKQKKKIFRAM